MKVNIKAFSFQLHRGVGVHLEIWEKKKLVLDHGADNRISITYKGMQYALTNPFPRFIFRYVTTICFHMYISL